MEEKAGTRVQPLPSRKGKESKLVMERNACRPDMEGNPTGELRGRAGRVHVPQVPKHPQCMHFLSNSASTPGSLAHASTHLISCTKHTACAGVEEQLEMLTFVLSSAWRHTAGCSDVAHAIQNEDVQQQQQQQQQQRQARIQEQASAAAALPQPLQQHTAFLLHALESLAQDVGHARAIVDQARAGLQGLGVHPPPPPQNVQFPGAGGGDATHPGWTPQSAPQHTHPASARGEHATTPRAHTPPGGYDLLRGCPVCSEGVPGSGAGRLSSPFVSAGQPDAGHVLHLDWAKKGRALPLVALANLMQIMILYAPRPCISCAGAAPGFDQARLRSPFGGSGRMSSPSGDSQDALSGLASIQRLMQQLGGASEDLPHQVSDVMELHLAQSCKMDTLGNVELRLVDCVDPFLGWRRGGAGIEKVLSTFSFHACLIC
eukprot:1149364-Pelagomonas_calceolata.AAC.5